MKKISTILGVLAILLTFSGCSSSNQDVEETSSINMNDSIVNSDNYISEEYSELFNTWYSATDIIAFTDDGEFYLTYDDINYCISGTYSIENDIISIKIDESTIRNNLMKVTDTSYKFQFVDGNLILTLADDETQSVTYYLDKSVALGQSD
ncbi:MAG: hypothetical protein KH373_03345 [Ruminococcus sp.]|nr:hypothetical protein [Ruminococcus sp.]